MTFDEAPLVFDCCGEKLVGVASLPAQPAPRGVVIVVGGPQYRVGSHRQFVQLARALAAAGFASLRFDCRGMGDGTGAPQPFDDMDADIDAAIGALQVACPAVRDVVLWGLCDGASAIAMYANRQDARVHGLVLVNPWVRDDSTYAQVQIKHYYRGRLASREWWRKLLRGEVDVVDALRGALGTARRALRPVAPSAPARPSYQTRMRSGVAGFGGRVLLMLSGSDLTAREFETHVAADERWQRALARPGCGRRDFAATNHTFSDEPSRQAAEAATVAWLRGDG